MRKLKFHEYKLLKKADFLQWKRESNLRETKVLRRYHVQNPDVSERDADGAWYTRMGA